MKDVLVAYPMVGANATRVREIADAHPRVRVSALVENPAQAVAWRGSRVGIFIDVNPGMNRTGVEQEHIPEILDLARAIQGAGLAFRGLHYYDGHLASQPMDERESLAHRGYDRLMKIAEAATRAGFRLEEVVTSGTPAFHCAATYPAFRSAGFVHRASPGTVVYGDMTSQAQLPADWGYQPAAVVVSTVVSHPKPGRVTCDAGHKSVSADGGVPTCEAAGRPDLRPLKPSEEHLPIEVAGGCEPPAIGEALYLIPRHVCPTVNNFDDALIISQGRIVTLERVTARGHASPLMVSCVTVDPPG